MTLFYLKVRSKLSNELEWVGKDGNIYLDHLDKNYRFIGDQKAIDYLVTSLKEDGYENFEVVPA